MLRGILVRLGVIHDTAGDTSEQESDENGTENTNTESGFVPSRLDASVLAAHGMSTADTALDETQEQGRELEAVQHEERENR